MEGFTERCHHLKDSGKPHLLLCEWEGWGGAGNALTILPERISHTPLPSPSPQRRVLARSPGKHPRSTPVFHCYILSFTPNWPHVAQAGYVAQAGLLPLPSKSCGFKLTSPASRPFSTNALIVLHLPYKTSNPGGRVITSGVLLPSLRPSGSIPNTTENKRKPQVSPPTKTTSKPHSAV